MRLNLGAKLLSRRAITEGGCWEWTGAISGGTGYGSIRVEGKAYGVHVLAARTWKGEQPPKTIVCHTCDNRKCFNPDHLYYGTARSNVIDMMTRLRGRGQFNSVKTRGTKHVGNVLSEEDVRVIRIAIESGERGVLTGLAEHYGVTVQLISRIKHGRVWSWLA